jgi:predicted RND superfamily exporter protein
MSLGVGFGVDYGIYIVSRAMEEHRRQHAGDLRAALIEGVATAGKAVLYTAFLISAGIIFWVFSPLRFQAEMGYGLLIILTMNMLGGLIFLPAFIGLVRPRFFMESGGATRPQRAQPGTRSRTP